MLHAAQIGVGIGQATMFYVGGYEGRCEYFAAGPSLRECFAAADAAVSGDVIVSGAVWEEVKEECQSAMRENGFHAITAMEKTVRKRSVKQTTTTHNVSYQALRGYAPPVLLSAYDLETSIGQSMRGWTVSVVQASVLFVNLGIGGLMDQLALDCSKIHVAVLTVQRIVQTLQGCIHRFTVDDKGCVMKVVFGAHLPHEDQPYRALLAALQLRQALSLQGIQPAVGVASGLSLIGPVGSAARQEFTVHGDKIILAARLMQLAANYGGMVLCDERTYASTRDDVRFVQLQPVELKGKSAIVRPYRPVASSELLEKPTLTVKPSLEYCSSLEAIKRTLNECSGWLADQAPTFRALVVTGSHGAGKTQLLMQARSRCEKANCRVLHVRCRAHEAAQRGALLRRLFAQLCGHDVWPSLQHITPMMSTNANAEEALVEYELKLLHSHAAAASLPATGSPSSSPFASPYSVRPSPRTNIQAPSARTQSPCEEGMSVTSKEAVTESSEGSCSPMESLRASRANAAEHVEEAPGADATTSGRLTLIIDDLHHADAHSCEVLERLARSVPEKVLMLLTCREPRVSLGIPALPTKGVNDEAPFSPGHRLVHKVATMKDSITSLNLRPVSAPICDQLACAELGVASLPSEASSLVYRRSGGCPLLCQSIARNLVHRGALFIEGGNAELVTACSERMLNSAATEALIESCHSVLCVKLSELSILQQLLLKAMSLLPEPCSQSLLMQALPVQISQNLFTTQLRELRDRHLIAAPSSHRRSLPGHLSTSAGGAGGEIVYQFVDVGMREVCQHLMVDSQKRQIRLRIAAANESKQVLGSLADSLTSSVGSEEGLARSLSPSMLRSSKLRDSLGLPGRPAAVRTEGESASSAGTGTGDEISVYSSSLDCDPHWWMARSPATARSPARLQSSLRPSPLQTPSRMNRRQARMESGSSTPSNLGGRAAAKGSGRPDRTQRPQVQSSTSSTSPASTHKSSPTSSPWHSFSHGSVRTKNPQSTTHAGRSASPSPTGYPVLATANRDSPSSHAQQEQPPRKRSKIARHMAIRVARPVVSLLLSRRRRTATVRPSAAQAQRNARSVVVTTPPRAVMLVDADRSPPLDGAHNLASGPLGGGAPFTTLPRSIVSDLEECDRSLDGRMAGSIAPASEALAMLVGTHRRHCPPASRKLF